MHPRTRQSLLAIAAYLSFTTGVFIAGFCWWWWPAGTLMVLSVVLLRVRRRFPWTAGLIMWWEVRRLSATGQVGRWRLWERFVAIAPEPHKDSLDG